MVAGQTNFRVGNFLPGKITPSRFHVAQFGAHVAQFGAHRAQFGAQSIKNGLAENS
jgi:hypothetical protein